MRGITYTSLNEHPGSDPLQQQFNTLVEVARLQAHVTSLIRELRDVKSYLLQLSSRVVLLESEVISLKESNQGFPESDH